MPMQQIPVTQLQAIKDQLGADPVLLDVREPWEVQTAPLAVEGFRTVHIPMNLIPSRLAELDANSGTVCVCHHGMRSLQVALFLERQGFDPVFNLHGGVDAWSRQVDPSVARY
jgi:rhodanese-related sulfurtransferase